MRLRLLVPLTALLYAWGDPGNAFAQFDLEVTFDDADDGIGADEAPMLANLEGADRARARLVGSVVRSAYEDGQYGRGAWFPDENGRIVVMNWRLRNEFIAHLWVRASAVERGTVIAEPGGWALAFDRGDLVFRGPTSTTTLLPWPADDEFHHLTLRITNQPTALQVEVTIDFSATALATAEAWTSPEGTRLVLGDGFRGWIDELILASRPTATMSAEQDRFNRWPQDCVEGAVCDETVLDLDLAPLGRRVPVRFKTVYRPELCGPSTPCRLLIAIQGGATCANDYESPNALVELANAGFLVATVDPYCEGDMDTTLDGTEIPQLLEVKNYMLEESPLRDLLEGPEYFATGTSHGAEAVLVWALFFEDFPLRTFARSAGGSGLCAMLNGHTCAGPPAELDLESDRAESLHRRSDFVGRLDPNIVATREIARSWGANLEGPVCGSEGRVECREEGLWGMTYASRRFRSVWRSWEAQAEHPPTGYFVEDVGEDCRHGGPPETEAFRCGVCMLSNGRVGMASACPECLTYASTEIREGPEALACELSASWYEDPLTTLSQPPEPSEPPDEEVPPSTPALPIGSDSGCSCDHLHHRRTPLAWLALLPFIFFFVLRPKTSGGRRLRRQEDT